MEDLTKKHRLKTDGPDFNALSLKYQMYCLEYLRDFNADRAYMQCISILPPGKEKGKAAKQADIGRFLKQERIQKALKELISGAISEKVASAEELMEYWTCVMRGNIKDICSWGEDGVTVSMDSKNLDEEKSKLIKKIRVVERPTREGIHRSTELEVHDPLKASELLGRTKGIFIDKVEHSGPNGTPLFSDTERAARLQHLLALAEENKRKRIEMTKK